MTDSTPPSLEQIAVLEQALDERKKDRRQRHMELPPEIERRSGRDRREDAKREQNND